YVKNLRNRRSLLVPLRGFTLAEVLITLGIIGVVAALTIPTLMQKTNRNEHVAAAKKFYANFTNAVKQAEVEHGPWYKWDENGNVNEILLENMKVVKDCGYTTRGCFANSYKYLDGEQFDPEADFDSGYSYVLSDGASIHLDYGYDTIVTFDTNGLKGPNQYGIDLFDIYMYASNSRTKINEFAFNICDDSNVMTSPNGSCALVYILKHGNMDYLDE
ncbi:type II secretion system protein, partial [bacterium]|nr:type II secretion system protein [bacterium]